VQLADRQLRAERAERGKQRRGGVPAGKQAAEPAARKTKAKRRR
jgi:hypothetical protein